MDSTVRVVFLGEASSAVRSVSRLEGSFGTLGRAAKLAGAAIATGIVGGLALAVKSAVKFDGAMRTANQTLKLNEKQLQATSKQVLALSKSTSQGPASLAEGLKTAAEAGFKANDALKILAVSGKAASATQTDIATVTKTVATVLNQYGKSAGDARQVTDVLVNSVETGGVSWDALQTSLAQVLPIATSLKVPFADLGGILTTLGQQGQDANRSAMQLRMVMGALLKPNKDLTAAFKELGISSGEASVKQIGLSGTLEKLIGLAGTHPDLIAHWFPARSSALIFDIARHTQEFTRNIQAAQHATDGAGRTQESYSQSLKSISGQWKQVKASLAAAAVPVGQLLLPALSKVAGYVGAFAQKVQADMPQIRAAFGDLAGVVGSLGSGLAGLAGSAGGQSVLVGVISAIATAKGISGTKNLIQGVVTGVRALGPAGTIAAAAVGILAGAWYLASRQGSEFEGQVRHITDALNHVKDTALSHKQALELQTQAQINASMTTRQASSAEALYANAVRTSGRDSDAARSAYDNLRQAKLNAKIATDDLSKADQAATQTGAAHTKAVRDTAKAYSDFQSKAEGLRHRYADLVAEQDKLTAYGSRAADSQARLNYQMLQQQTVKAYATQVENLAGKLGVGAGKAQDYGAAVGTLVGQLGRLPTFKEVRIFVAYQEAVNVVRTVTNRIGQALQGKGPIHPPAHRAMGGFLQGATGQAVPVVAHAGEIILNPQQQMVLGGPKFLADLFGFSGARGPGSQFAAGGFVAGWPYRTPDAPHRPGGSPRHATAAARRHPFTRRQRAMTAVKNANADVAHWFKVIGTDDFDEELGERQYSDLDANFQIDEANLQFILTDATTGMEAVNYADVAKRQGDLNALIAKRNDLIATYLKEVDDRRAYLVELNKAIQALIEAIRAQQERIKQEQAAILTLRGQIAGELSKARPTGPVSEHTIGVGPNRSAITGWQREIIGHQAQITNAQEIIKTLGADLTDYRGRTADEPHNIAFANQDVADQRTLLKGLQADLSSVNVGQLESQVAADNTSLNQSQGFTSGADAFGGSGGAGAAAGTAGGDSGLAQQLKDYYTAKIATLKLALGIQNLQMPIIGSFQRGALHVPSTGLAYVHAGEQILTAGHPAVSTHTDPAVVYLTLTGGISEQDIDMKIEGATDKVIVKLGREADRRQREGRY